jgi:outer membrane protein assembly factor BamB
VAILALCASVAGTGVASNAGSLGGLGTGPWQAGGPAALSPAKTVAWSQYGYDAGHSGFNASEKTLNAKNVSSLQVAWSDPIIQAQGIALDDGTLYVTDANDGELAALDATTGAQKWATSLQLGTFGSFPAQPAVAGGTVLSPCGNTVSGQFKTGICGLNAKNGKVKWSQLCSAGYCGISTSPAVYGGLAYYQFSDNYFTEYTQAVEPKSGRIAWSDAGTYDCKDAGQGGTLPLPAGSGYVFAPFACTGSQKNQVEVCALVASSGANGWCTVLPTQYITSMFEGEGKLFVTDSYNTNNMVALDETSGKVIWSISLPDISSDAFAVANDRVFIQLHNGNGLDALSAKTGALLWSQKADINGAISVANGVVYTNGGGCYNGCSAITALDEKTGATLWESPAGNGASSATAIIADGTVYAGCYNMCAFTLPQDLRRRR